MEIRAELEGETIEAVDDGMRRGASEKSQLERWVETDRQTLAARAKTRLRTRARGGPGNARPDPGRGPRGACARPRIAVRFENAHWHK